jgi:hypothetical protein
LPIVRWGVDDLRPLAPGQRANFNFGSANIGADSKATSTDRESSTAQCKIGSINRVVWTRANLATFLDMGYDADAIAREIMERKAPIRERVALYERAVNLKLTEVLVQLKRSKPDWYTSQIDRVIFDILIGTFENGHSHTYRRQFTLRDDGKELRLELTTHLECPGDCKDGLGLAKMGHAKAIEAELNRNPDIWNTGFEVAIRHLVQMEIDSCPRDVGLPIATARFDIDGLTWISEGACSSGSKAAPFLPPTSNIATACSD